MKSSIFTPADRAQELRAELQKLEAQIDGTRQFPITVNLTGKPLTDEQYEYGAVDLSKEFEDCVAEIVNLGMVDTAAEMERRAKRLLGAIMDIHPAITDVDNRGVCYLIDGPTCFVAKVVNLVGAKYKLVTPIMNMRPTLGVLEIN